jgi:hypothetical protein
LNPRRRGGKPATNRLSYGAAGSYITKKVLLHGANLRIFAFSVITRIPLSSTGYSGGNPSGFVLPGTNDFANYGYGAQNPYNPYGGAGYVPVDFNTLFQQYLSFMQHLAQQQAYATK